MTNEDRGSRIEDREARVPSSILHPPSSPHSTTSPPRYLTTSSSVKDRLFREGFAFDFFQAVRLLEKIDTQKLPVGRTGPPHKEAVRFRAHESLGFPASQIYEIEQPSDRLVVPAMTVTFFGLTGPSGALPRHYSELLMRLHREAKGLEKHALRAWLDQFNHRLISLFYRAWEKYRFYIPYERGDFADTEPDTFSQAIYSLVGLGVPSLRNRLHVSLWEENEEGQPHERILTCVDDLAVLHYGGYFAHRPRCAIALEALLQDYFRLPMKVQQFRGQWLQLDAASQSRMGDGSSQLGVNVVAGTRVWDVQSKIRIRIGPLRYAQFAEFLPDPSHRAAGKAFFMLTHLVRLYVGPELDTEVQLVLRAEDIPSCQLGGSEAGGARLGWNTWINSQTAANDAEDAVFEGREVVALNERRY